MSGAGAAGFSAERLAGLERTIAERFVQPGKIPGALTLVWRRGEVAHLGVQGMADVEARRPLREDAIFRIYSMTKPITSVAFMMLVEEGKVALDDPVHRFLPAWKDIGVYAGGTEGLFRTTPTQRPMLMIDLLRHTSGLTYGFQRRSNVDAAYRAILGEWRIDLDLDTAMEKIGQLPLEFSPGEAWNYSVSTDVLGCLIGKISGVPLEQFLQQRIFDPLGMTDTSFWVPPEKADRVPAVYWAGPGGRMLPAGGTTADPFTRPPFISGGGGLYGTAADYLRFCRMVLNGGELDGARLLSPHTIALMGANHLPGGKELPQMSTSLFSEASYAGSGFGLGFSVMLDPSRALLYGSPGDLSWGGAASTYFWIDPAEEMVAIFMTQLMPSSTYPIRRDLRTLVYSALLDPNLPHGSRSPRP